MSVVPRSALAFPASFTVSAELSCSLHSTSSSSSSSDGGDDGAVYCCWGIHLCCSGCSASWASEAAEAREVLCH